MNNLIDGLLVDVYAYLLPELGHAAASSQFVRAADCAGRMRIAETYAECCEVEPADVAGACSWRGLAACWARNAVWLRASPRDVVAGPGLPEPADARGAGSADAGGDVVAWRDALRRGPRAVPRERNGLVLRGGGDDILEGTVLVVASARGDCTIFDAAHDDGASRLELCHGYPPESQDAAAPRISLFSPAGGGGPAAIHRGATRSTGEPHVYSVALRREAPPTLDVDAELNADLRADVFVDARREVADAALRASRGFSDRIVLGADHQGRWPLNGAIRAFALFRGRVPDAFRAALERALAAKHGIDVATDATSDDAPMDDAGDDDSDDDDFFDDADDE